MAATTPTLQDRGYIPTGNGCSYKTGIGHISRLNYINIDNCAMNCDSDPDCKSFSIWNDQGSQNGFKTCMLNSDKTSGKITNGDTCGGFYNNGQSYDKPTPQIVKDSNINFYTMNPIANGSGSKTSQDSNPSFHQQGHDCGNKNNVNAWNGDHNMPSTTFDYYDGAGGAMACVTPFVGAQACLPGKVISTELPTYRATYTTSWDTNASPLKQIKCNYESLDPAYIVSNWEHMDPTIIPPEQQILAKQVYCKSLDPAALAASNCNDPGIFTPSDYNTVMINACNSVSDWTQLAPCLDSIAGVVQNNDIGNSNANNAVGMIHKYCRGGDGTNPQSTTGHRSDPICSCLNASDFGIPNPNDNTHISCYDQPAYAYPGCNEVRNKTTDIKSLFEVAPNVYNEVVAQVQDSGDLADSCAIARSACQTGQTSCILPYEPAANSKTYNFNVCTFANSIGKAVDSPIKQTCGIVDGSESSNSVSTINPTSGSSTSGSGTSGSSTSPGSIFQTTTMFFGKTIPTFVIFIAIFILLCICSVAVRFF